MLHTKCFAALTSAFLPISVVKCPKGEQSSESTVALLDANGTPLAGERGMQASHIAGLEHRTVIDGRFVMPVSLPTRAIVFGGGHVAARPYRPSRASDSAAHCSIAAPNSLNTRACPKRMMSSWAITTTSQRR